MANRVLLAVLSVAALGACGEMARLPVDAGTGPEPQLPPPNKTLIPTVNVATAAPWQPGMQPRGAPGTAVNAFATGLEHPRWLLVLPNGDVLVAETNAPPKPDDGKGLRGWFMKMMMKRAGAGVPSANRITLLRDADGDGVAETRSVFAQGLNSPFGMALVGNQFYVANSDALVRYAYRTGDTTLGGPPQKIVDLPAGTLNHHWTKNVIASPDGSKLYVTVGSNSNVGENGIPAEEGRAAIWEVNLGSGGASVAHRVFASGLRNPNGMAWEPVSGALWTVVNERDEIGSDLVPDYLSSVRDGGFYGWPYCDWGQTVDDRVPQDPAAVARAITPDYALGGHTASLGLCWMPSGTLPGFPDGMVIGQHGSWNRSTLSGYKVVFVPFTNGRPSGPARDILSGFLAPDERESYGRPVGVTLGPDGSLLVADDVGDVIWRVTGA
jgi:glucose/arabinose dehydrogenase